MSEVGRDMSQQELGKLSMRDMLQALTGGRPYIFVIMAYGDRWDLYERIRKVAEARFNVACVRADELKSSGYDLLHKIHYLISHSDLVIAEISRPSENVFYEIGYAVGMGRKPLLLVETGNAVPTDLKGIEALEYRRDRDGILALDAELTDHLSARLNLETALLRDMLEAPKPRPAYIVSSPKYPTRTSRIRGQVFDTRTFGDGLGILGLISAFGSVWGVGEGIELVSAQHSPPNLIEMPLNLYLIGSQKVNPHAGKALHCIQFRRRLKWVFAPAPGFTRRDDDWPCALYRQLRGKRTVVRGKTERLGPDGAEVWTEDYGIIVRGPHPNPTCPGRLVLVLAGAHSLGTGAACLAATRPQMIREIRSRLPEGVLEGKERPFWALVKGTASRDDVLLDMEGVTLEDAGVYT